MKNAIFEIWSLFCSHCLGLSVSRAGNHVTLPPFAFVRITGDAILAYFFLHLATRTPGCFFAKRELDACFLFSVLAAFKAQI